MNDKLTLLIYDYVGDPYEGVTAKDVVEQLLEHAHVREIDVLVNSVGGDVFDGMTIYNTLVRHQARVTVYVDGAALSIASVIAQAGDRRVMAPGSLMMIHDPWTFAAGDAGDMRKAAEMLDQVRLSILDVYEQASGQDRAKLEAWMREEKWFTAAETVAAGLADEVAERVMPEPAAALLDRMPLARGRRQVQERIAAEGRQVGFRFEAPTSNRTTVILNKRRDVAAPEPMSTTDQNHSFMTRLWNAVLNKTGTAPDELDILDEVRQLRAKSEQVDAISEQVKNLEDQVQALSAERDTLKAENATLKAGQAEQLKNERAAVVAQAVADLKIPKAEEASWLERMEANPDGTTAFLGSLKPGAVSPSREAPAPPSGAKPGEPAGSEAGYNRVLNSTKVASN